MSTVISMLIGSKLSTIELVTKSICSIIKNFGTNDFLLVVGLASHITLDIRSWVNAVGSQRSNVIVITDHCESYAEFQNHVFLKYTPGSKWFVLSHDDIELQTPDFIGHVEKATRSFLDKVGWIAFTDTDYMYGHCAPSVGGGFHADFVFENAWLRRKLHQFHLLRENYWKKNSSYSYLSSLTYDFPCGVVKCHGPLSHLCMIETEKLKRLGLCENWSEVSLLTDEDWALTALKENLFNIWIPHIQYRHCRIQDGTRAWPLIVSRGKQVANLWERKWGFRFKFVQTEPIKNREKLRKIKRLYGNTNIVWSMDKQSFDWEYIE